MQLAPQKRGRGALSPSTAAATTALLAVALAVAPASPARANGYCDNYAPALDVTVTCVANADVTPPPGANYAWLEVIGGGGGAATTNDVNGSAGGSGAIASGWAELPGPTTYVLKARVGTGGPGGVAPVGGLGGAQGGGGSGVFADVGVTDPDTAAIVLVDLMIAGGGGGGSGTDSSSMPASGGDAGSTGQPSVFSDGGGAGGLQGTGGTGGVTATDIPGTAVDGLAGAAYVPGSGDLASGGAGATINTQRGGSGGGGYGGGGGGGASSYGIGYAGAGGGGGSSFANGTFVTDTFSTIATSGPGVGGLTDGAAGTNGRVRLRFTTTLPSTVTSVSPGTGSQAGGGTLIINGSRLTGSTAVTVGSGTCTILDVAPSQISCTIPPGTVGLTDVVVTTPGGDVTFAESYTYTLAEPTVTAVTPAAGPLAGTGPITITGTFFADATAVDIGGSPCDSFTVQSPTTITCAAIPPNAIAGAVDVHVTTPGGTATRTSGYRYAAEPTISTVSPVSGLQSGGGTLFVNGTALPVGGVGDQITVGGVDCGGINIVVSDTRVSCELPPSETTGAKDVTLTTPGGTVTLTGGFEYQAPTPSSSSPSPSPSVSSSSPSPSPSVTTPTVLPTTTSPTPSPTPTPSVTSSATPTPSVTSSATPTPSVTSSATPTPSVTPTPTASPAPTTAPPVPSTPPKINLDLNLTVNASVVGSEATLSGDGMRPNSTYVLTMYSTPVPLAAGRADANGSFSSLITMPSKACVSGGLHELVLSGTAADGSALRDSSWIVMDDTCTTRSQRTVKPVSSTIVLSTVRFSYLSDRLSPYTKSVLRQVRGSLGNAKRITVTGHAQNRLTTGQKVKESNLLAKKRAIAVRTYLLGIGVKTRVVAVGAGGLRPMKGMAQKYNRRVVITVLY